MHPRGVGLFVQALVNRVFVLCFLRRISRAYLTYESSTDGLANYILAHSCLCSCSAGVMDATLYPEFRLPVKPQTEVCATSLAAMR